MMKSPAQPAIKGARLIFLILKPQPSLSTGYLPPPSLVTKVLFLVAAVDAQISTLALVAPG